MFLLFLRLVKEIVVVAAWIVGGRVSVILTVMISLNKILKKNYFPNFYCMLYAVWLKPYLLLISMVNTALTIEQNYDEDIERS